MFSKIIKDRFQEIIKDRLQKFDMFNMFQTAGEPMVTEQTKEEQGETSPGDTHGNVDQEAAEADSAPQETVCH